MNGNVSHYMWDVSKAGIFFFFFTGNCICKEHTATCSTLKDVCEGGSEIHFPKSSGQPNA